MFIVRAFFNGLIIASVFAGGFYTRHKLDFAFETLDRIEQSKEKAATLWPF